MYGMGLIIVPENHSPESSYGEVEDGFQSKRDYVTADFLAEF